MEYVAWRRVLGAVALATAITNCSGKSDTGGGVGAPIGSGYVEQTGAFVCDAIFRCNFSGDDAVYMRILFGSEANCRSLLQNETEGRDLGLAQALEAGTVSYDADRFRQCLTQQATSCGQMMGTVREDFAACRDAFAGNIAPGGECHVSEECAGNAFCDSSSLVCPGVCRPRKTLGEACGKDSDCSYSAGPATCWGEMGPPVCVPLNVHPDAGKGQTCGLVRSTSSHELTSCQPGLWCEPTGPDSGSCQSVLAAGANCTSSGSWCAEGQACVGGRCQPIVFQTTAGTPCGTETQYCDPRARLECVNNLCEVYTDGSAGSPCRTGDSSSGDCRMGLVCLANKICGPPLAVGAACTSHRECQSGQCSSDLDGVCLERSCRDLW